MNESREPALRRTHAGLDRAAAAALVCNLFRRWEDRCDRDHGNLSPRRTLHAIGLLLLLLILCSSAAAVVSTWYCCCMNTSLQRLETTQMTYNNILIASIRTRTNGTRFFSKYTVTVTYHECASTLSERIFFLIFLFLLTIEHTNAPEPLNVYEKVSSAKSTDLW